MLRLHAMLKVTDLEESIRFYSTLFAAEPSVREADYAKWMLDEPRVNFSIAEKGQAGFEHLGIQAETPEELEELRERIGRAEGIVSKEGETTCCYHKSDKSWITDPQGVSWEAFYTSGRSTTYAATKNGAEYGDSTHSSCCLPGCCEPASAA